MHLSYAPATPADADTLVAIRIAAMRASLEAIGRFDPQRARDRFVASFDPATCRFIVADGVRAGFVVVRHAADHWRLDHLYLLPGQQRRGIGAAVLDTLLREADAQRMPVRVGALRGSDSNRFYLRHGFVVTGETEWDIDYLREPRRPGQPE
ncbi:GNAT family N-acetyltransferase [Burkholderia plantarii]|uniref:GNAT family N-acetyltransferase n=1 Tax=Burkholderia plantarii TaxID=41899 RepID=UPI0018DBA4B0|nr:GNAT family N-acetyltransferase [Burkholderia plantarii]MBI0331374.1 GNAT family N-acetyltransferase [Burkholderia plantarii]